MIFARSLEMKLSLCAAVAVHAAVLFIPASRTEPPRVVLEQAESSIEVFIVPADPIEIPEPIKPPEPIVEPEPLVEPEPEPLVEPEPFVEPEPEPERVPPDEPEILPEIIEPLPEVMPPLELADEPEPAPVELAITSPALEGGDVEELSPPSTEKTLKIPYPQMAKRRGQEGTVVVRIHVDAEGNVEKVEIIESSGFPLLDRAVLAKVQRHTFLPATRANIAVAGAFNFSVLFKLK